MQVVSEIWTLLLRCLNIRQRDGHLAIAAIEMQCEATSVVKKEKRTAVLGAVVDRTYAEFISDAVSAAHKLGFLKWRKLVCFADEVSSGRFVYFIRKVV